jgi:hypothetical protein
MELMTLGVLNLADYSCCKAVPGHRLAAIRAVSRKRSLTRATESMASIRFSILNASATNERRDQCHDSNHDGT